MVFLPPLATGGMEDKGGYGRAGLSLAIRKSVPFA